MLFLETIRGWKGVGAPSATSVLLNSNRIGLLEADGSNSKFYYSLNPYNQREKPHFIQATTTVANLLIVIDDVLSSNAMSIPVFPDDDPTATPVQKYVLYEDFVYAVGHATEADKSWVYYYSKGYRLHRVLVDYTLAQLESIAETGATV